MSDQFRQMDKKESWNKYGPTFWKLAPRTSHPTPEAAVLFLNAIPSGSTVAVIGATTVEVSRAAQSRGLQVTVLDFAENLLAELAKLDELEGVRTCLYDVLTVPPPELIGHFDFVLSDRLINRFHKSQWQTVMQNMGSMIKSSGEIRASVRIGLYPLDVRLINEGLKRGTLDRYWETSTSTIDWRAVGSELDNCAERLGEIEKEVVVAWSRLRGVETRIDVKDIICAERGMLATASLQPIDLVDLPGAPNTLLVRCTSDQGRDKQNANSAI